MDNLSRFDRFYIGIKGNRWHWYFSIFCRLTLALGFFIAGMVKIMDERFASGLSIIHPMGAYLEALHHTGYYYHFIGVAQVLAAVLLLIPRTVTLGAMLYLPIIVNICILSFAVRFEGSFVTAPLMVLANLYILLWNFDKVRYMLPFNKFPNYDLPKKPIKYSNKFPLVFFTSVFSTVGFTIFLFIYGHDVMPRNSLSDCKKQFMNSEKEAVGLKFCECIHINGKPLDDCLAEFENEKK